MYVCMHVRMNVCRYTHTHTFATYMAAMRSQTSGVRVKTGLFVSCNRSLLFLQVSFAPIVGLV